MTTLNKKTATEAEIFTYTTEHLVDCIAHGGITNDSEIISDAKACIEEFVNFNSINFKGMVKRYLDTIKLTEMLANISVSEPLKTVKSIREELSKSNLTVGEHKSRLNSRALYYVDTEMGTSIIENMTRKSLVDNFNNGAFDC